MGATASLTGPVNVNHLSSQEVGALAASIGPVYQPYAQMFIDEGITGVFLATKDDVGFKKVLEEIGITRELHRDNIYTLFMSLKDSTNKAAAAAALDPSPPAALGGPEGPRMPPVAHTSLFPYGDGLDLGLEGALAALRMPTLGPADAEAALRAVADLCRDSDDNSVAVGATGGCAAVADVFRRYASTHVYVAQQACRAVLCLACGTGDDVRADQLVSFGVAEVVALALRTFAGDEDLVEYGCWAIRNLASGGGHEDARATRLIHAGVGQVLVSALKTFPANADIAEQACGAIKNLAVGSDERRDRLTSAGACAAVVDAMVRYGEVEDVALQGCGALCKLALGGGDDAGRAAKLHAAGAADVLVAAVTSFATNEDIVEYATTAMCALSVGCGARKRRLMDVGAAEALALALLSWPRCGDIVVNVSGAVYNLCGEADDEEDDDEEDEDEEGGGRSEGKGGDPGGGPAARRRRQRLLDAGLRGLLSVAAGSGELSEEARAEATDAVQRLDETPDGDAQ